MIGSGYLLILADSIKVQMQDEFPGVYATVFGLLGLAVAGANWSSLDSHSFMVLAAASSATLAWGIGRAIVYARQERAGARLDQDELCRRIQYEAIIHTAKSNGPIDGPRSVLVRDRIRQVRGEFSDLDFKEYLNAVADKSAAVFVAHVSAHSLLLRPVHKIEILESAFSTALSDGGISQEEAQFLKALTIALKPLPPEVKELQVLAAQAHVELDLSRQ